MTDRTTGGATGAAATGATRPPAFRCVLGLVFLVIALSTVVRVVDLARYPEAVFDEHYYVHDAGVLLRGDLAGSMAEPWKPAALRSVAHPDLAKLAMAASIGLFGDHPWAWRLPGALCGIALVALVFPLARRLGLSDEWALAALVLAAADPMLMLHSRLAVLDVYVALTTALAVYLGLRYVQSGFRGVWLVACGAALGAAVACKWSGLLAFLAVLVVIVPPLVRQGGGRSRWLRTAAALVLTPLAVYLASSLPYFAAGHGLSDWLRLQTHMATFGWGVTGDSPFASRPATWPFVVHPVWYSWSVGQSGTSGLLAIGNWLLWWSGVLAWVVLGVLSLSRRDWRLGLAPALVAALHLPWLLTTRQTYIFYMVPVVPFIALLVATALSRIAGAPWTRPPGVALADACSTADGGGERLLGLRRRRIAAWVFCLACAAVGALYVPFVVGWPVPFDYYVLLTPFTTWK